MIINATFSAFGCDDLPTPAYAWVSREGDLVTVGCYHSDYEWKMSCVGSKWIGPQSNCTDKKQGLAVGFSISRYVVFFPEIIKPSPTPDRNVPLSKKRTILTTGLLLYKPPHQHILQKSISDILFALIIGITVLLCAVVITVGYVCLKR